MKNLENLSKYKYVYAIYKENNTVNIERFTIIYSNEQYIYYKFASKSELSKISLLNVEEKYDGITDEVLNKLRYTRLYVLNIDGFDIEEARLHFYKKSNEKILEDAKLKLDRATKAYNDAKADYEQLLKISLTD